VLTDLFLVNQPHAQDQTFGVDGACGCPNL
jgi:hypothetical protein